MVRPLSGPEETELFNELRHYMDFAFGAYGWPLLCFGRMAAAPFVLAGLLCDGCLGY